MAKIVKLTPGPIFFQVDLRIAMIISLTVIVICLVAGIAIIVCCFAPCCPLYEVPCCDSGGCSV
jgi:hypothetical protein